MTLAQPMPAGDATPVPDARTPAMRNDGPPGPANATPSRWGPGAPPRAGGHLGVTVTAYRGVDHATTTLAPTAVVAGPPGSGRSSFLEAAAAALARHPLAVSGLAWRDAPALVRDGAPRATARVQGPGGSAALSWPDGALTLHGCPPWATAAAAGLTPLLAMGPAARLHALLGEPRGPGPHSPGAALTAVNETLARLTAEAGWPAVTLDADAVPSWEGRPAPLLSATQRICLEAALRVVHARRAGASAVVLDEAAGLTRAGLADLLVLLGQAGVPALMAAPAEAPDAGGLGLGTVLRLPA